MFYTNVYGLLVEQQAPYTLHFCPDQAGSQEGIECTKAKESLSEYMYSTCWALMAKNGSKTYNQRYHDRIFRIFLDHEPEINVGKKSIP